MGEEERSEYFSITDNLSPSPPYPPNWLRHDDFTPIFLGHARVYAFAHTHDIPALKEIALDKLRQSFKFFTLWPPRCEDIIKLVEFVYEHPALKYETEIGRYDDLKFEVLKYTLFYRNFFQHSLEFSELLKENTAFGFDFANNQELPVL